MRNQLLRMTSLTICMFIAACSGTRPAFLGMENSTLQPCPDSPNCVTSITSQSDTQHYIQALSALNTKDPIPALETVIKTQGGTIIVSTPIYVYAEFTSDIMRFVDDVEFLLSPQAKQIEVRSASRLGHKDFEVNRERIEEIRSEFNR